jgi:hypothetical protein
MLFIAMSCFPIRSDGQVSLIVRFLEKSSEYQRKWLRIDTKIALELLHYAKQKLKTGLRSNGILAILCHKVDMGEYLFLFGCARKLFENGHIVLNKYSKIPGGNIGMFIAD